MRARPREPIHVEARMVNRMEIPQQRNPVKCAMYPVTDQVDEEQHLEELQHERLRRDFLLEVELDCPREGHLDRNHRGKRDELDACVADEEMLDVGLPAVAEDL